MTEVHQHSFASNNETRILGLDGLRGLCILWVIFHNLYPYGSGLHNLLESSVRLVANMGWIGVQWFFVLSGFLITNILLRLKESAGSIRNFYVRRILRIFPVYYLTLIVFIFVLPAFGVVNPNIQGVAGHQLWYWFYLVNWIPAFGIHEPGLFHLWSLAVEEQFYCIWPWLILWLPRRWMIVVCLFCLFSSPLLRYLIVTFDEIDAKDLAYDLTIVRWDALALGALFAFACAEKRWKQWFDRFASVLAIVVVLLVFSVIAFNRSFPPVGSDLLVFNQTLAALFGVILLNDILYGTGLFKGHLCHFFKSSFLRLLGKYSYAMYVFHLTIYVLLGAVIAHVKHNFINISPILIDFVAFFLICLASFTLAALSWRYRATFIKV